MNQFKKEAEKIKAIHKKLEMLQKKVLKEIECLNFHLNEDGDEEFLAHYDNYLLGEIEALRKIDKQKILKMRECWSVIPYSMRPQNEYEWDVDSEEALETYKKYYNCSKPYDERLIMLLKEIADLKRDFIQKTKI